MATYEALRFNVDTDLVFDGVQKAIADLGLKVDLADIDRNIIEIRSGSGWRTLGGEKLSISFLEEMANFVDVRVSARLNSHGEILEVPNWNAGRKIAKMILARLSEYVDQDSPGKLREPSTKPHHCHSCHEPVQGEEMYCETCGRYRASTRKEYEAPVIQRREESEDDFFDSLGMGDLKDKKKPAAASRPKPATPPPAQTELLVVCDCGARLRIKSQAKGAKLKCPKCQLSILLE
jgi:hypothetical protein